jgi:molybdopterin synthase catalytic subunit
MTPSTLSPLEAAVDTIYITESALDIVALLEKAHHPKAGAIVLFSGDVRNHSNGRDVEYLEYEAQVAIASRMISEIIAEAKSKWDLTIAVASHRIGKVPVCESAVVVITASAHRNEAFMANRYIIDRIKHEVPIWKCEFFTDGTKEWGGNCNCHTITGEVGKHVYQL